MEACFLRKIYIIFYRAQPSPGFRDVFSGIEVTWLSLIINHIPFFTAMVLMAKL